VQASFAFIVVVELHQIIQNLLGDFLLQAIRGLEVLCQLLQVVFLPYGDDPLFIVSADNLKLPNDLLVLLLFFHHGPSVCE